MAGMLVPVMLCLAFLRFANAQICSNHICEPTETRYDCPRDCWLDTVELFRAGAGRVDWSKDAKDLIAFDMAGPDSFFDVYTIRPDGTGLTCLTCTSKVIPQKHNGQPAWHPTGEWIVFQCEVENHEGGSVFATPGRGRYCDLWVLSLNDMAAFKLTTLSDSNLGVLHPHFSNDGRRLSWSQLVAPLKLQTGKEIGSWQLKVADFEIRGGIPALTNILTYQPADSVFYENHGFSPNDSCLIFTSNFHVKQSVLTSNNIYILNLFTGDVKQLTDDKYNEHATYTPDGSRIVWGANRENQLINPGMDLWTMNPDGTNKQRLTYFNKSGGYENLVGRARAVDHSWNAAGDRLAAYVQTAEVGDAGDIYILKFHSAAIGSKNQAITTGDMARVTILSYPSCRRVVVHRPAGSPAPSSIATLKIFCIDGRPLAELAGHNGKITWDTHAVARGVYLLQLEGATYYVKVW